MFVSGIKFVLQETPTKDSYPLIAQRYKRALPYPPSALSILGTVKFAKPLKLLFIIQPLDSHVPVIAGVPESNIVATERPRIL